jgi:acetylornithine deacetylase/succinyl-diaminopimelate desuccinylase-like protein
MNKSQIKQFVYDFWEQEIIPSLSDYIRIPNKSPVFDPNWQSNGHMDQAVDHVVAWCNMHKVPGMNIEVHRLENRTPTILIEVPGDVQETVLLYGHLDKQPEFTGWHEELGPWQPVIKDHRLYGRGGADDGYAVYASVAALLALKQQNLPLPRIVIIIECSEESGSPDLPFYMDALADRVGAPELVIALDSTAGNYDQLWCTTSLRGMLIGTLKVEVLEEGAHSGAAGGIVSSSFRILRQLLERLEDDKTGEILPDFLKQQVPPVRLLEAKSAAEVLGDEFRSMYRFAGEGVPVSDDPVELVINNSWQASLAVTGMDGIPSIEAGGNVLRPFTAAKLALRLSPTTDAAVAAEELSRLLLNNPPHGAKVTFELDSTSSGWHAPTNSEQLEDSLQQASMDFFGDRAIAMGCGGSIPFMEFLAVRFPRAQFVVTGVLGPHSNAHGPNEFLDIPTAKKLTACVSQLVYDQAVRRT